MVRWPEGVECPRCGSKAKHSYITTRRIYMCKACRKQFSPKAGTIFEDSPLGMDKWMVAVWVLTNTKNGTSSHELGRSLGITQKSAWFMLQRIRHAMTTGTFENLSKLGSGAGDVESRGMIGEVGAIRTLRRPAKTSRGQSPRMGEQTGRQERCAVPGLSRPLFVPLDTMPRLASWSWNFVLARSTNIWASLQPCIKDS